MTLPDFGGTSPETTDNVLDLPAPFGPSSTTTLPAGTVMPLGKMGERLMIHPTSVTNIVDCLERQGLVIRVDHPTDRRTTQWEITPAGRRSVEQASAAVELGVAGLAADDVDQLVRLLTKLRRSAGDFAA